MSTDRRKFLQLLTTGAASAAFPASIARALAIPANHRTGTIDDVEHIVVMMQENRSFDHYFGTLRGVRGFGDPRAVKLPTGKSVFHQPDPANPDGFVLPFRPDASNLGLRSWRTRRTTGPGRTRRGMAETTTSGCHTRARPRWRT